MLMLHSNRSSKAEVFSVKWTLRRRSHKNNQLSFQFKFNVLNPKLPNYYFSCEIRCCQTDQSHTKLTLTTVAFGAWSIVRDQVLRLFGPLCKDPQYMLLLHLVDELLPLLFFLYNTVFQGGDFDHCLEVLLRVSLMLRTIRR